MAANTVQMPMQGAPTVANMDIVNVQISLPQLLDLALGTPEVGAVNFNILHNFLHVLLHQMNLQATKVEYRGETADRLKTLVTSLRSGPTAHFYEYSITDGNGEVSQRVRETDDIYVDVLTEGTQPAEDDLKVTKGVKRQVGPGKNDEAQTVIFVEPVVNGAAPTALAFKQLEQSVNHLQQQYQALEDLSRSPEVMERLKGRIADPVADVWQFININKRLDASEQGIDKLTTMLQDVMKGDAGVAAIPIDAPLLNARLDKLESKVSDMEQQLADLQAIVDVLLESVQPTADKHAPAAEIAAIDEATVPPREKEEISREVPKAIIDRLAARRPLVESADIAEIRRDVDALKADVAQLQRELRDLNERIAPSATPIIGVPPAAQEKPVVAEAIKDKPRMDKAIDAANLEQCLEAVKNLETTHGKVLHDITQRVDALEKEVGNLSEKLESAQAVSSVGDADINELVMKIQDVQMDMEKFGQTADRLLEDKESREVHLNTLLEQIELLKTIKADKEDLEDALADKADAQTVNRKVSHDQFDAACDDLTRGLEEAVDKLSKQELIWQQALDEVQNEIASKVDKIEMTPLKDFVNNRLKSLQEKLKSMAEMRPEREAAGTKKLLRDVQCISCDKDVVMKTEEVSRYRTDPLPCTSSMKPYLTYELDQVRKQQRKLPHSRNMIQFEAAMQEETKKIKTAREETLARTPRDHLCNRYCGGSHTITTPQQRVMRVGHFLTQWGPEVVQLTDGLIRGKDGQMYRSRLIPGKLDICGPSCWENQVSEETQSLEHVPPVSTSRKSAQSRRNSAGTQRRVLKKNSKESGIIEPATKPIVETQRTVPSQEINDISLVTLTEPQNEIALYEVNKTMEEEQVE